MGVGGSLQTNRNGVSISYPTAERWINKDGADTTESHIDVLFSADMQVAEDKGALFLTSPENKVFTWIKPVIGGFRILDGYNLDKGVRSATYITKNAYLDTDKFSPYVVITAPASNYGGSLYKFMTEMNFITRVNYANGVVAVQPSLRTQLEPYDIFIDSEQATTVGKWTVVSGRGEHEKTALRADATEKTELTLNFTVSKAGVYYVRARVGASPGHRFLVSLDNRPSKDWQFGNLVRSWEPVNAFSSDNKIYLTAGAHKIKLQATEAGSLFDALALFYERDVGPTTLQYAENTDRTQPEAMLNGIPLRNNSAFTGYAFKSPYVTSIKDSGSWIIQYGNEVLSLGTGTRNEPITKEAENAIGLPSSAIKVDLDGTSFVELSNAVTSLRFEFDIPAAGRYILYGRTRAFNGHSNSFTVLVNGTSYTWGIPKDGKWGLNGLSRGRLSNPISLPAGKVPVSIQLREAGSQIDSLTLIRVP